MGNIQAGFATGTWGTEYMAFGLGSNGAAALPTERMRITGIGNVGIGTSTPQSELAVNGIITAKDLVLTTIGWPDYVFDKDYLIFYSAILQPFILP